MAHPTINTTMKKALFLSLFALLALAVTLPAQTKYSTKTGTIKFSAESALSDAKAENHQVRVILDPTTKELAVSLLITSFEFEKALMQTHFNGDMDSEKYPKSTFSGKITSPESLTGSAEVVKVTVSGDLTIHGVTKKMESVAGTLQMANGKVTLHSEFKIDMTEFKVATRPGVQKTVTIKVDAVLNPA